MRMPTRGPPEYPQPPKELPREGRPFTRRVRGILEGTATAGEPLWAGCAGCRGVLGTALPLSPCDLWYCRASEALWKDEHGRSGYGYPCAARDTSVYPNALACLAIALTLRSWYCAS